MQGYFINTVAICIAEPFPSHWVVIIKTGFLSMEMPHTKFVLLVQKATRPYPITYLANKSN